MAANAEKGAGTVVARPSAWQQFKSEWKAHLNAASGELLGTTAFLFMGELAAKTANLGRTAAQQGTGLSLDVATISMISLAFGLSLLTTAWLFYRITGGLFNPAVSLALWLVGALTGVRAIMLSISQMLGGLVAAALVLALLPAGSGDVDVVNTTLSSGTSVAQGVILELIGSSVLIFSILMLAVEKHRATYLAPVGIGLTLFVLHLGLVAWTGCALNPSRAFGPAVVSRNFPSEHWIYWVGPIAGAILAVIYFEILKALSYNSAVLNQDSDQEVVGLRPVHMRVFKRLRGDKDWKADGKERRRFVIRRKKAQKIARMERRDMRDIGEDTLERVDDQMVITPGATDDESMLEEGRLPRNRANTNSFGQATLPQEQRQMGVKGEDQLQRVTSPGSGQTLAGSGGVSNTNGAAYYKSQ